MSWSHILSLISRHLWVCSLKKLLICLSVLALSGIGALFWVFRDIGPDHPVLRTANLPVLIPTYAFFADPRAQNGYRVSNDGELISYWSAGVFDDSTKVIERRTGEVIAELPGGFDSMHWHPIEQRLRFLYEGVDWEVDPRMPDKKDWKRISPQKLSRWVKLSLPRNEEDRIVVEGNATGRAQTHLYLVSQDGAEVEKIAEGGNEVGYWILDKTLNPRIRVDYTGDNTQSILHKEGSDWVKLVDVALPDVWDPVDWIDDDGTVLVRSSRGRDKIALVRFDIRSAKETVIYETVDSDVGQVTRLSNSSVDVLRAGPLDQTHIALTKRGKAFLKALDTYPQPVTLGFIATTASGRYVTAAISPQEKSYIYLLIDLETGETEEINEYHFRRYKDDLVNSRPVHFIARDGVKLNGILTMPAGVTGPIPFVVEVHGGPADHFRLGYDHMRQFIANRGYGILSLNFRGSDGFGKRFQGLGFREFGRKMQDDVADAGRWLIDQDLADPKALAVQGISYGGYAAAMAMTRDPNLFKAAIIEFPLLDVVFQSKYHPGNWRRQIGAWQQYFGNLEVEPDRQNMHRYSPVNLVEQIHGPILMLAGLRDPITAVQQAKNFEAAMNKVGKPLEAHYFETGHGVSYWKDAFRRTRLIEDFLAKELGGRSGGIDPVEIVIEYID